ncbi:hypothetical protein ABW20_dc0106637 [Dactylellina cionopaga]|nr:hypothetical protein ABW20_dc0106637 [Dactylellina cionopaga]
MNIETTTTDHSDSFNGAKPITHAEYTVGWVCALASELIAAIAMLQTEHPNLETPATDQNTYTLGSIGKHNIVIACLPKGLTGNNSAATVATQMINTFPNIKFGLMVGTGSGIPPKVRLGDVVVSTPIEAYPGVVQWGLGRATENGFQRTGALNKPPRSLLTALTKVEAAHAMYGSMIPEYLEELKKKYPKLAPRYLRSESLKDISFKSNCRHISKSIALAEGLADPDEDEDEEDEEDNCRFCDKTKVFKRDGREMQVHFGLIASGDQIINDAKIRNQLNKELGGKVLCVETEAAGLSTGFPCLIIRGIRDYADAHQTKYWQEHAAAVAAAFARELLGYVQPSEVDRERPVKDILLQRQCQPLHQILSTNNF